MLKAAAQDYAALQKRCAIFDDELMADLAKVGGENYARRDTVEQVTLRQKSH